MVMAAGVPTKSPVGLRPRGSDKRGKRGEEEDNVVVLTSRIGGLYRPEEGGLENSMWGHFSCSMMLTRRCTRRTQ